MITDRKFGTGAMAGNIELDIPEVSSLQSSSAFVKNKSKGYHSGQTICARTMFSTQKPWDLLFGLSEQGKYLPYLSPDYRFDFHIFPQQITGQQVSSFIKT